MMYRSKAVAYDKIYGRDARRFHVLSIIDKQEARQYNLLRLGLTLFLSALTLPIPSRSFL